MIGALFIHQDRTESAYYSMASCLRNHCPELRRLRAYGTDGDQALFNAMKSVFPESLHLLCDLHMKDNITSELEKCEVAKEFRDMILRDIFGSRHGDERFGRLLFKVIFLS